MSTIRSRKGLLKLIGIALFLFIIIFKVDLREICRIVRQIETGYLIAFLVVVLCSTPLQPMCWKYILKKMGLRITFTDSYMMVFMSTLLGLVTPARIGEIGGRVSFFLKSPDKIGKSVAGVILERAMDIMLLSVVGSLAILLFAESLAWRGQIMVSLIPFLVLAIGIMLVRVKFGAMIKKVLSALMPSGSGRFDPHLDGLDASLESVNIRGHLVIALWTTVLWSLNILTTYMIARSVHVEIRLSHFAVATAVASLASMLPISISGIGTKEAVYMVLLAPFGVPLERIVTFSVTATVLRIVILALIGLGCWLLRPRQHPPRTHQLIPFSTHLLL